MNKLLHQYHLNPTLKLAQKIRAYARAHPFDARMMDRDEADLLADIIHHANSGERK